MTRTHANDDVPVGLPRLSPGRHLSVEEGVCFMEAAALLAGEPLTDRPRCTNPALAALAQLVNDACTERGRSTLLPLVPDVIGLTAHHPRLTPLLVRRCIAAVAEKGADTRHMHRYARHAERRLAALDRGGLFARWCRLTDPLYRHGPAQHALAYSVARLAGRDDVLVGLLDDCIRLSRSCLQDPGPVVSRVSAPTAGGAPAVQSHRAVGRW